jgi:hypothetical protein
MLAASKIKIMLEFLGCRLRFCIFVLISITCTFSNLRALPPETLDFSLIKYGLTFKQLFPQPIKQVCINSAKSTLFPAAAVFSDKVVFFDDKGSINKEYDLPDTCEIKVKVSSQGEYIYVYGHFTGRTGGFHRLFRSDGKLIFKRDDSNAFGPDGMGTPVAAPKYFLLAWHGFLTLTDFDGRLLVKKQVLNRDNFEDGDIYTTTSLKGKIIYAVANKYKVPFDQTRASRPIFYTFDTKLNEITHDTLPYLIVNSISCSNSGGLIVFRTELENGASPVIITDARSIELHRLDNLMGLKFSAESPDVIDVPRAGRPEIISSQTWETVFRPNMEYQKYSWIDYDISPDGADVVLYDGDSAYLLDNQYQLWGKASFPFAFSNCRIWRNGGRLIFSGEFGFVVYDIISK